MDLFSINIAYASLDSNIDSFVSKVNQVIVNPIITLLFGLAVVYFLWGVFQFLSNSQSEEARATGKNHILWGIIGMVVMMGVFAILNIIMNTFNITGINPEQGTVNIKIPN